MSRARRFARFWWDFVVGDDWLAAAGVAIALALTAVLTHSGMEAWWLLPLAVTVLLTRSLRCAARQSPAGDPTTGARTDG